MIDADLEYPPEINPDMVDLIERGRTDIVIAKRNYIGVSSSRKTLSLGFSWLCAMLLGIPATDIQAGEKAFSRTVLDSINIREKAWGIDVEILFKATQEGYRIAEIPIDFSERRAGVTKINTFTTAFELLLAVVRLFLLRVSNRVRIVLGIRKPPKRR